ncbi:hypothetical protein [uncultured Ruegeria sp.]|uniref:hypothetical protein n=1 Tax=uncultured Ruegeria sp. TaxID=259304 RepID=UPI0026021773|nr:hypothetical protein [uncultured Ruegeria sp.]
MELVADILLVAGALGAGLYCFVLSRRLKRFTNLEKGVGGAVAVLSSQADELRTSLESARAASDQSGDVLKDLTQRAETVAQRLELMMASMHDVVTDETVDTATKSDASPRDDLPSDSMTQDIKVAAQELAVSSESGDASALDASAKVPEGVMFFRHDRKQNEAPK